jgi:hypothetical protein
MRMSASQDINGQNSAADAQNNSTVAQAKKQLKAFWDRRWRVASVILSVIVLVLIAHMAYVSTGHGPGISLKELLITVGLFVLLIVIRVKAPNLWPTKKINFVRTDKLKAETVENLISNATTLASRFSGDTLALLADMISEPATYRTRLIETVELNRRLTKKSVTINFTISPSQLPSSKMESICLTGNSEAVITPQAVVVPSGDGVAIRLEFDINQPESSQSEQEKQGIRSVPSLLIPLMQPPKGRLYNQLEIRDRTGGRVNTLPHEETAAVYCATMLQLYRLAFGLPEEIEEWGRRYRWNFLRLVLIQLQTSAELTRLSKDRAKKAAIEALSRDVDVLLQLPIRDPSAANKLKRMAQIAIDHYLIIAECKSVADDINIGYGYEVATQSLMHPAGAREGNWLTRLIQELFGVPSGYVMISMTRARHAQSYHLYVHVPHGSYIGPTSVFDSSDHAVEINPRPATAIGVPYLRPVSRYGSHAHIYGRQLALHGDRLRLRSRVLERPTGMESFAVIASVTALVVSIVLWQTAPTGGHSDTVLALLALPATLAAVAVFFSSAVARSLTVSTAGAGLSLIAALIIAVVVVCTLLDKLPGVPQESFGGWLLRISVILATLLVAVSLTSLSLRIRRYRETQKALAREP